MFATKKIISDYAISQADTFESYALAVAAAARFYGDTFGTEYAEQIKVDAEQDIDESTYVVQFYSGKDPGMDDVFVAKIKK